MATASILPNWVRNEEGIDLLDALLAPIYVASTLVVGGLATVGLDEPIRFYLADALYAAQGVEITWGSVFSFVVLGLAWFSNEATTWDDFDEVQAGIVAFMVIMNLAVVLIAPVSAAVTGLWYVGVFMVMLNGAGYYLIAYW